jgi:hypothetical protein
MAVVRNESAASNQAGWVLVQCLHAAQIANGKRRGIPTVRVHRENS